MTTTIEFITALFCQVDDQLTGLQTPRRIFPLNLDAIFPVSYNKSVACQDIHLEALLSTCPLAREGDLQGLENPGLLVVRAREARNAVGVIEGISQ